MLRNARGALLVVLLAAAAAADPGGDPRPMARTDARPRPPLASRRPETADPSVVDVVVAAGLAARDTIADTETSIAVDPDDPRRITLAAFSGGWGQLAPLWLSTDGGSTWRRRRALPAPPGGKGIAGCPCDQTFDYGRGHRLYGAALAIDDGDRPTYVAATADPERPAAWAWPVRSGVTRRTNPTSSSDQPWIAVGPDPGAPADDLVYVAYTDYSAAVPTNHVAVLAGGVPARRLRDRVVSTSPRAGSLAAAAVRVAADRSTGAALALWQDPIDVEPVTCARRVELRLARSLDGGDTWSPDDRGTLVARTLSFQGRNDASSIPPGACRHVDQKFGGVNALLGGTAALAVDAGTGDAWIAFVDRDPSDGPGLKVARVRFGAAGEPPAIDLQTVAAGVIALPSIAVAAGGTVGVLFNAFDGTAGRRPRFSVHLAQSDGGSGFVDRTLASFTSPASPNARATQRALGDYQQLRAVGDVFYAAFPANGTLAGRTSASIDPFFARVEALTPDREARPGASVQNGSARDGLWNTAPRVSRCRPRLRAPSRRRAAFAACRSLASCC